MVSHYWCTCEPRVVVLMYFREGHADVASKPSWAALAVVVTCAIAVLVLGLFPSFIIQVAQRFI
jgi:NADH:ubiquinone oxidoreductase subunit 2 (subunit N)